MLNHNRPRPGSGQVGTEQALWLTEAHVVDVLTGSAGDVTVFDSNCMHGSGGNITPFPRSNVFIVFNSVENTCTKPFSAGTARPEFLGATDTTPVGR